MLPRTIMSHIFHNLTFKKDVVLVCLIHIIISIMFAQLINNCPVTKQSFKERCLLTSISILRS